MVQAARAAVEAGPLDPLVCDVTIEWDEDEDTTLHSLDELHALLRSGAEPMTLQIIVAHVVEHEASLVIDFNGRWLQMDGAGTDWTRARQAYDAAQVEFALDYGITTFRLPELPARHRHRGAPAPRGQGPGPGARRRGRRILAGWGRFRAERVPGSSAGERRGVARARREPLGDRQRRVGIGLEPIRRPALRVGRALPDPLLAAVGVVEADVLQQRLAVIGAGVAARAEQAAGVPDEPLAGHRVDQLAEQVLLRRRADRRARVGVRQAAADVAAKPVAHRHPRQRRPARRRGASAAARDVTHAVNKMKLQ